MAASAALSIWRYAWQDGMAMLAVALLFALGGVFAYAPAVIAAGFVSGNRRPETRFATFVVALATATIGATALLFGLYYRAYYAAWHGPAFSIEWTYQFVFTVAAAVYHFCVLGIRLFIPIGFPALLAVSLWHGARVR